MHAGNWNILVPAGKENNNDSPISSERKGNRANWISFWKEGRDVVDAKTKSMRESRLEWRASEGDSPVLEVDMLCTERVEPPRSEVRIQRD